MKKRLLLILVLVFLLSGCGCAAEKTEESAQATTVPTADEPVEEKTREMPEESAGVAEEPAEPEIADEALAVAEESAEPEIVDEPAEPEEVDTSTAMERGLAAIEATGDQKYLMLPKEESYLEAFKTKYIDVSEIKIYDPEKGMEIRPIYGPSVAVERQPKRHGYLPMPWGYLGTKCTVVAEENDMSCIIYRASDGRMRAGWIWDHYLGDFYPGKQLTTGSGDSTAASTIAEVPLSWSKEGFLGGGQNYLILEKPVNDCVGFTLDYQLIDTNTEKWCEVLGPRTVYVNNGEKWIKVGSFEYPEFGPVLVRVNLDEPTDIVAIGTMAQVRDPYLYYIREYVIDYAIAD